jgi:hypothetical protein
LQPVDGDTKAAFPRSCKSIVQLGKQAKNLLGEQKILPSPDQTASCTWRSKVESDELRDGFSRLWKRSLRKKEKEKKKNQFMKKKKNKNNF